jgi:hypothetical protein
MRTTRKALLAVGVAGLLLGGCAAGPYDYYDNSYAYNNGPYYRSYSYPYASEYYYAPGYYVAPPSLSFGLSYHRHRWR